MAYISKNVATLERARVEYVNGILPPNDVARQFNLKPANFRDYLVRNKCIKPEHTNAKKRLVENTLRAVKEVQNAEVIMPTETQVIFSEFQQDAELVKGKGLKFAISVFDKLNAAVKNIDETNLDEVLKLENFANAAKRISDYLGLYPKAPTIAIQNNLQQNLQTQNTKKEQNLRLIFDEKPENERD